MIRALLTGLTALFIAGPLTSCAEPDPLGVQVQLIASPYGADPFESVTTLVLKVVGDDLEGGIFARVDFSAGGSVDLSGIPFSDVTEKTTRQLLVEGWATDAAGDLSYVVSQGRSQSVTVWPGGDVQFLQVLMARVNQFQDAIDYTYGAIQTLQTGRVGHTVTATQAGEIVVSGGGTVSSGGSSSWWQRDGAATLLREVEIIDEATFTATAATTPLCYPRIHHTSTPLPTGQIFFSGGWGPADTSACWESGQFARDALNTIEFYNPPPEQGIQLLAHGLDKKRVGHTATLINDDPDDFTVLFVGGDIDGVGTYEVWNPWSGSGGAKLLYGTTANPPPPVAFHAATQARILDPDNPQSPPRDTVLIVGGENGDDTVASMLLYDIASETMFVHPSQLPKGGRTGLTATFVDDQNFIYIIGGFDNVGRTIASNAIDVYDTRALNLTDAFRPDTQSFNLIQPRGSHTSTLMNDDAIFIAGGSNGAEAVATVEIIVKFQKKEGNVVSNVIDLACSTGDCGVTVPALPNPLVGHAATFTDRGVLLITGGAAGSFASGLSHVLDIQLYNPEYTP